MKISSKEQYGLRAMAELAARYGQGPVPLAEVAEAQGLSRDYLEQIVPALREAGLVQSTRGAHGGYQLARAPETMTVGQVLRALEGEIFPLPCVSEDLKECDRSHMCTARAVWTKVHARVSETLDEMTMADL
jgi:Rrf2 family protein